MLGEIDKPWGDPTLPSTLNRLTDNLSFAKYCCLRAAANKKCMGSIRYSRQT